MCLTTADVADRCRIEGHESGWRAVDSDIRCGQDRASGRGNIPRGVRGSLGKMQMLRHVLLVDCGGGAAGLLAESMAFTLMNRHTSTEVRQGEIRLAVAPVGCSKQREERLVLVDRQELAIAKRPAF